MGLLLQKLSFVDSDLFGNFFAHLDPLFEVFKQSSIVEKDLKSGFEALIVGWSGRDMHFALREYRVLSKHQFIEQNA